jgi:hypothetical protein
MKRTALITISSLLALLTTSVWAQTQEPSETAAAQKQAKLEVQKKALESLDALLKELGTLRLPENRIRAQATAADLLWKHDEKRARALFAKTIQDFGALAAAGNDEEVQTQSVTPYLAVQQSSMQYAMNVQIRAQLRSELLQLLARHDARMARDFLRGSRVSDPNNPGSGQPDQDAEYDLQLASQIVTTDPKQASQIAQESLRKGYPYGVFSVLAGLQKTDKDLASELAAAMMQKLHGEDLAANPLAAGWAFSLLSPAMASVGVKADVDEDDDDDDSDQPKKPLESTTGLLNESSTRELVDLIAAAALKQAAALKKDSNGDDEAQDFLLQRLRSAMPLIEKYAPTRVGPMKTALGQLDKTADPQEKAFQQYQAIVEAGDYKKALDAIDKAPAEVRDTLAMQAAFGLANHGELDRARDIINEHVSHLPQKNQLLAQLDRQALQSAAQNKKLDDARPMLARLSPLDRAAVLVQFADAAAARKDTKQARAILDEARTLLPQQPANHIELQVLLQIARSAAAIDTTQSFDIIEAAIDQLNPLLGALAALDGYEYTPCFKDGELLIGQGASPVLNLAFQCVNELEQLSSTDFVRARAAADRFVRADLRMMSRLAVLRGVLSDQPTGGPQMSVKHVRLPELRQMSGFAIERVR